MRSVPVAELQSSFFSSDNGGSYQRLGETLIIGPAWARKLIAAAPLAVEPMPFGIALLDNAIICGEGIILKKMPKGFFVASETLANVSARRSILPMVRSLDGALHIDGGIGRRHLSSEHIYVFLRHVYDNNYAHWVMDILPKIAIVADHFDLTKVKFILTRHWPTRASHFIRKIYFDSLAEFGVKPQQIVQLGRGAVEVEQLLYPMPIAVHDEGIKTKRSLRTIEILEALRDRIANGQQGPRRIYASRANAAKRRLLNEADVLNLLKDHDFTVVCPETFSFVDQVRLFANAEIVIGPYGANLTNAVFAKRGIKMFALTSQESPDDFFWDLTNLKSGKYFSLHGDAASANPDASSDFFIDTTEFRRLLEERVLS